jgi:hypothetical protein
MPRMPKLKKLNHEGHEEKLKNSEVRRQESEFRSFFPHLNPLPKEAVSQCHCEGVKRPKQSHQMLKIEIATLPAVTRNDRRGL